MFEDFFYVFTPFLEEERNVLVFIIKASFQTVEKSDSPFFWPCLTSNHKYFQYSLIWFFLVTKLLLKRFISLSHYFKYFLSSIEWIGLCIPCVYISVFMHRSGELRECLYFSHANLTYLISLWYKDIGEWVVTELRTGRSSINNLPGLCRQWCHFEHLAYLSSGILLAFTYLGI